MRIEGHSVVHFQSFFFLFGGYDIDAGRESNAVLRIDVADATRGLTSGMDAPPTTDGGPSSSSPFMHNFGNSPTAPPTSLASRTTLHASVFDDVAVYVVPTTGPAPAARAFHACCMRGPYMVVWGGSMRSDPSLGGSTSTDAASPSASTVHDGIFKSSARRMEGGAAATTSVPLDATELFALNLETMVWSRYQVGSIAPGIKKQAVLQPRCHTSMVCAEESLMLYGGYPTDVHDGESDVALAPNEWCVFRITGNGQCEALEPAGAAPSLWGHAAVYAHRCLMVFGGIDAMTNDDVRSLCVYNVDEGRWRWAEFPEGPCARALHTAVLDPTQSAMIVYGGFSSSPDEVVASDAPSGSFGAVADDGHPGRGDPGSQLVAQLNDVWSFSLETGLWERLYPHPAGSRAAAAAATGMSSRSSPTPSSPRAVHPDGRSGHAAVYHDHRMFVFGGLVDRAQPQGPGTPPPIWGPSVGGLPPAPRDGGLLIFDLTTRAWRCKNLVVAKGAPPSATAAVAATANSIAPGMGLAGAAHGDSFDAAAGGQIASRASIIDRYLNIQPEAAASDAQKMSSSKLGNSGTRTVAAARAQSNGGSGDGSPPWAIAGPSQHHTTPSSAAALQQHLVASTFQAVGSSLRRRSTDRPMDAVGTERQRTPSATSYPTADDDDSVLRAVPAVTDTMPSAVRGTSSSPLAAQRALANEFGRMLHPSGDVSGGTYGWLPDNDTALPHRNAVWQHSPSRGRLEEGGVSRVVESIAHRQNASDHKWSVAEGERRSKLLMQYVQSQGAPAALWSARSTLQEDETPSPGRSSLHVGLGDARFLVRDAASGSQQPKLSTRNDPANATRDASLGDGRGSYRLPPDQRSNVNVIAASLDVDEAPPVVLVRPHTPLAPGPWLP